jgi:hypothetical protein
MTKEGRYFRCRGGGGGGGGTKFKDNKNKVINSFIDFNNVLNGKDAVYISVNFRQNPTT